MGSDCSARHPYNLSARSQAKSNKLRGTVMSQLPQEAAITSTSAPRHYGVRANTHYKESEDYGREKIWDHWEDLWRVAKMTWYINKVNEQLFPNEMVAD